LRSSVATESVNYYGDGANFLSNGGNILAEELLGKSVSLRRFVKADTGFIWSESREHL
jgi:hypothetical protein